MGLFPAQTATAEIRGFRGSVRLTKDDEVHVRDASTKRREEFAAGRHCAAVALNSLGIFSARVSRDAGGAPIWPVGVVGSISHTDDMAAAVVAHSEGVLAIGLDIERADAVEPALWPMLFCESERLRLKKSDPEDFNSLATALFSAKEAFYKAQWPVTREWLDFTDVEIELSGQGFTVLPRSPRTWTRRLGEQVSGLFAVSTDVVVAAVTVVAP